MAMWEETLGPGVTLPNVLDWENFMPQQLLQLDEMQEASVNHPSIMAWAWFNEGPSNEAAACKAYAACAERAFANDHTRFLTWATNKEWEDVCLQHATMVSFNAYPSWYPRFGPQGDLHLPGQHWRNASRWARAQYPDKPFVISETGAGGIFEWPANTTDAHWTCNLQTKILAADVDVALSDANISGITIWHFFDFKANDHDTERCGPCQYLKGVSPPTCGFVDMERCARRPGSLNHKGVVDFWRRPKPAFAMVARKFNATLPPEVAQAIIV